VTKLKFAVPLAALVLAGCSNVNPFQSAEPYDVDATIRRHVDPVMAIAALKEDGASVASYADRVAIQEAVLRLTLDHQPVQLRNEGQIWARLVSNKRIHERSDAEQVWLRISGASTGDSGLTTGRINDAVDAVCSPPTFADHSERVLDEEALMTARFKRDSRAACFQYVNGNVQAARDFYESARLVSTSLPQLEIRAYELGYGSASFPARVYLNRSLATEGVEFR